MASFDLAAPREYGMPVDDMTPEQVMDWFYREWRAWDSGTA